MRGLNEGLGRRGAGGLLYDLDANMKHGAAEGLRPVGGREGGAGGEGLEASFSIQREKESAKGRERRDASGGMLRDARQAAALPQRTREKERERPLGRERGLKEREYQAVRTGRTAAMKNCSQSSIPTHPSPAPRPRPPPPTRPQKVRPFFTSALRAAPGWSVPCTGVAYFSGGTNGRISGTVTICCSVFPRMNETRSSNRLTVLSPSSETMIIIRLEKKAST